MNMKSAFRLYNKETAVIMADAKIYAEKNMKKK